MTTPTACTARELASQLDKRVFDKVWNHFHSRLKNTAWNCFASDVCVAVDVNLE